MSTILKFRYHGTPCNVKKIQTGDLLRLFAKNHAFQNLMYLAIISVLNQPVVQISAIEVHLRFVGEYIRF